jgi:predicted DNA-binding antitoxin AbrB/MazE fold protein
MSVSALEGVVDDGIIRPAQPLNLPDGTKVYILVPETHQGGAVIVSPRLVHPEQITDFRMEVSKS